MFNIPDGIFSLKFGEIKNKKVGKEKSIFIEKGFLGIQKKLRNFMIDTYPHGAPIGGFGSGTISRNPEGDFTVWHLETGRHVYENIPACQFHVFQEQNFKKVSQSLSINKPKKGLNSFNWKFPKYDGKYSSLYPKAYYEYYPKNWFMKLDCTQFSPILPHNYKETSYPTGIYIWRGKNETNSPIELSIMLTWENITGWHVTWPNRVHNSESCYWLKYHGNLVNEIQENNKSGSIILYNTKNKNNFCISVLKSKDCIISYQKDFNPLNSGDIIWKYFKKDGILINKTFKNQDKRNAAGLAIKIKINPNEKIEIPFIISWDYPVYRLKNVDFYRYYTKYFKTKKNNSFYIAQESLKNYLKWEKMIDKWHNEFLKKYEHWLVSYLFNELYFLTDGGTIWDAKSGNFGLLECYDYFFYETMDVRFYASFPLINFWPKIEKKVMKKFSENILKENNTFTRFWKYKWQIKDPIEEKPKYVYTGYLKHKGACPHDLGNLNFPLLTMNAYTWRNPNYWKDLNSKYILLIYRDYILGGKDKSFLLESWKSVDEAFEYLKKMDKDNDGLIENEGFPDQTYDNWHMDGVSSYCGTLWLACLQAVIKMYKILGKKSKLNEYESLLKKGKINFIKKLWNGKYFDCYEGCNDIFSDQLIGQYYSELLGLNDLIPANKIKEALKNIYNTNVLTFGNGNIGAVNGRKFNGKPCGHEQGDDAWIGTNCFLAGLMISNGLKNEGWNILKNIYNLIYNEKGYYFRTPEGYCENGDFVGSMHMRPMAIWSIINILNKKK